MSDDDQIFKLIGRLDYHGYRVSKKFLRKYRKIRFGTLKRFVGFDNSEKVFSTQTFKQFLVMWLRKQVYVFFKKFLILADRINILTSSLEIKDVFHFRIFIDFDTEAKVRMQVLRGNFDFFKH